MTFEEIWQAGYDTGFRHGVSEGRSAQVLRTAMLDRLAVQKIRERMEEDARPFVGRLGNITEFETETI